MEDKGTCKQGIVAFLLALVMAAGLMAAAPAGVMAKEKAGLPEYEHEMEGKLYKEVYEYVKDDIGALYGKTDVGIPCPIILDVDVTNPDNVVVKGDFWYYGYKLKGKTLKVDCGGSHPGILHLMKDRDGDYVVIKMDAVEDGTGFDESARTLFGDKYSDFAAEQSNDKLKTKIRNQIVANYVAKYNLPIKYVKDVGCKREKLPKENIRNFTSILRFEAADK